MYHIHRLWMTEWMADVYKNIMYYNMSGFVFDTFITPQAGPSSIPYAGTWGPNSNRGLQGSGPTTIGGGP